MISFLRPWFLFLLLTVPLVPLMAGRGRRRGPVTVLRTLVVLFLALAAAGPRMRAVSDKVATIFVLDVSDSMGGAGEGLAGINRLLGGMRGEDEAGLVTVAARGVVEVPLRPGGARFELTARHDGGHSSLPEGLYAAAAALGEDGERRIVLVSDGNSTGGPMDRAARFARRAGILVDTLPAGIPPGEDVEVRTLTVPRRIAEGEVHELSVLIRSGGATAARLVILKDGLYIGEDRQPLRPGDQLRTYTLPPAGPGTVVYEVMIEAAVDRVSENNRGLAVTTSAGPAQVLWVGYGDSPVPAALEFQGIRTSRVRPGDIPDSFAGLSAWDVVILDNVSSRDLSLRTLDLLEAWVRTRGGGLMMTGGDSSFGLGAYQGTPVEKALPVSMDSPSSLYIPSLTMVMVIDKSGSMGGELPGGNTKLDLVKDAVLGAVEVLNPLYTFGMAAFDADVEWTIPPTEAGNGEIIRRGLAGLESGGGTVLYPAILEAYQRLVQSPSALRHLVVLSDGLSEPADYDALAEAITRDGITMSTVAVGEDSDLKLMENLAQKGGGRFWHALDATEIPRIFASESMIVSRGLVVEETIFPQPGTPAEALDGISVDDLPPLHGYVMTYTDPTAVEALRAPRGHPILVYGRYGLGRTAAFTSDLRGGWGRDWLIWDQFPRLLAQSVRWLRRAPGTTDTALSIVENDGELSLILEARTESGGFRSDLKPEGIVRGPENSEERVSLIQTAPGHYQGHYVPMEDGVYQMSVTDEVAGIGAEAYWTRAYSPEAAASGIDSAALAEAARIGGGRLLTGAEDPGEWWRVRTPRLKTRADLALPLTFLALVLLLADIAVRELPGSGGKRRTPEAGTGRDMESLIAQGLEEERHKPKYRRPTPAEAARILAERRSRRG